VVSPTLPPFRLFLILDLPAVHEEEEEEDRRGDTDEEEKDGDDDAHTNVTESKDEEDEEDEDEEDEEDMEEEEEEEDGISEEKHREDQIDPGTFFTLPEAFWPTLTHHYWWPSSWSADEEEFERALQKMVRESFEQRRQDAKPVNVHAELLKPPDLLGTKKVDPHSVCHSRGEALSDALYVIQFIG